MLLTPDQFGKSVVQAGLSSVSELKSFWNSLPAEARPRDGETFSQVLVERGQLTPFQAQRLLEGEGNSLVLGEYVLLDVIGAGGMGQVFQAKHRRMDRMVALKLLPPSLTMDEAAVKRFEREVRAAAKLTHPNIVVAYDAGQAKGQHFLVMEYVDGTDLSSHVKKQGPLAVSEALDCVLQAARGLQYAHEQGVVHRDIKPANLVLDRKGTVKILDMGLARLDSAGTDQDQLTGTGQIMGTIDYMAPEQALATKHADARADIYSLGITLWYLLTGRAAYEGDSVMAKLLAHRDREIPSLRQARQRISSELDAAFAKMIAKTPGARYQTMTEVVADLERCQRGGTSAPAGTSDADDDGRLNTFLRGSATASPEATVGRTMPIANSPAVSAGLEPTITLQPSQNDTDPQTQQSMARPVAASPIPGISTTARKSRTAHLRAKPSRWLERPSGSRVGLIGLGGTFILLLAGLTFFVQNKHAHQPVAPPTVASQLSARGANTADDTGQQGATDLFNGRDLTGWTVMGHEGWRVEDGILIGETDTSRGWLMSDREYGDLELELEYRISSHSNSGVFLRAWPEGPIEGSGFHEIQILDETVPEFSNLGAQKRTGALYNALAAQPLPDHGPDQWHRMLITVQADQVRVEVNGVPATDGQLPPGKRDRGRIGLQLYPHRLEFRRIRIRELGAVDTQNPRNQRS